MAGEHPGVDSGAFDEPAVRGLLAGGEEEIGRALACIHTHLRRPSLGWLRRQFPGAGPDDLEDAWGETLLDVLRAARLKRFRADRPLWPWLSRIARCGPSTTPAGGPAGRGRSPASACCSSRRWVRPRARMTRRSRPRRACCCSTWSSPCPARQRTVLEVFFAHYPESAGLTALHREVSPRHGRAGVARRGQARLPGGPPQAAARPASRRLRALDGRRGVTPKTSRSPGNW